MLEALRSQWKDILLRTFDIRMGEFRRVGIMLLNIFLLIQCLWIIKPVVNAQFLSRVGIDKLPLVFLLVALTALAFSTLYSKLIHRFQLGPIILKTYWISIAGLLIFGTLLHFDLFPPWLSYAFYISVALFGLITTSQFWLLANLLFSSLEAKRLFGFIGAGAIAGGISGGYLTTLLAQFMNSEHILFVAAGLLFIGMLLTRWIWKTIVPAYNKNKPEKKTKSLQEYPLRLIRNSRHLTFLALIIGISVLVAKLVEFQFSAIASKNITSTEGLTAYFGFWFSTANVVALIIQLVLTQRAVGFLGVGRSLFVLPGALFMSAAAVLQAPVLWAGTLLKVMDISLKQSINKAATELLIIPVPMAIKSQAKTYIDVFVDTTATGLGGLMLIFLVNGLDLSVRSVSVLILLLIGIWIYFAIKARNEYILAFQRQLGLTIDTTPDNDQPSISSFVAGIRHALQHGSTDKIMQMLDSIEESKDPRLLKDVIPFLQHPEPRVRHGAVNALYYFPDHSIIYEIEPLLKDPHDLVRSRAFSAVLAHTRQNRVQLIYHYLTDPDPAISGAALVGLATETRNNPKMQSQFRLHERLLERLKAAEETRDDDMIVDARIILARAIGYGRLESFYPDLRKMIKDEHPAVMHKAIIAAGNTGDTQFVRELIFLLTNDTVQSSVFKALSKYKPAEILPVLMEINEDPATPYELLLRLPSLAETMDTRQAMDFLLALLSNHDQPTIKQKALEALHNVKAKFPHLTISGKKILPYLMEEAHLYKEILAINYAAQRSLHQNHEDPDIQQARKELITLFEQKLDEDLKRIFWILGLSYPPGMILPLYDDIRHKEPEMRINAVELLDNVLEPSLKKVILSIVETAMLDKLSDADVERLDLNIPDGDSCYDMLVDHKDENIRNAVVKLTDVIKNHNHSGTVE